MKFLMFIMVLVFECIVYGYGFCCRILGYNIILQIKLYFDLDIDFVFLDFIILIGEVYLSVIDNRFLI